MNNNPNRFVLWFVRRWKIIVFLIVLAFVLIFISRYGRLKITVENPMEGEQISYHIKNQATGDSDVVETDKSEITKTISRGDYEVLVNSNLRNGFTITSTGGFFRTTEVTVSLSLEKERQFVGSGPDACQVYNDKLAISYGCISTASSIINHNPATKTQASFNSDYNHPLPGVVEDIFITKQGTIALIREDYVEKNNEHYFYTLDENYKPTGRIPAKHLSGNEFYFVETYKNGFAVHNRDIDNVLYYSSINRPPKVVEVVNPVGTDLSAKTFSVNNDGDGVVHFSNTEADIDEVDPKTTNNSLVFVSPNKDPFGAVINNKVINAVRICGEGYVCLLLNNFDLEVYKLDESSKLQYEYKLTEVNNIYNDGNSLIAVSDDAVIRLNVASGSGVVEYSFGNLKPCGFESASKSGYLICVRNLGGESSLLHINPSKTTDNYVDQKAFELLKIPEVESVSVYKDSIFVVADYGDVKFDPIKGYFDYDPETKKSVNNRIREAASNLGIESLLRNF